MAHGACVPGTQAFGMQALGMQASGTQALGTQHFLLSPLFWLSQPWKMNFAKIFTSYIKNEALPS